jgi:hypothetical protein
MKWSEYFNMMIDWKKLPAYKVEPRIDSLVGHYLKDLLSEYLENEIIAIIPEFPIRLATVKPQHELTKYAERSYKVDFYAIDSNGKNYMVEFKTDSESRRVTQDDYLAEAKTVGMKGIAEGIYKISKASSYKKKYSYLLGKLQAIGVLNEQGGYIGKDLTIEIIYFQPSCHGLNERSIDFKWFSEWLMKTYPAQEFEVEFAKALLKWSAD